MSNLPICYHELADWWPLFSSPDDYAEEASAYRDILLQNTRSLQGVLELGSGGGNNASHLKTHFAMTLVDRSEKMLAVSRKLNPECEHLRGDMRSVRLGRQFDAVFIHDAVMYMTSESDLRQTITTAFIHCKPGGTALLVPDCVRETFRPGTSHGGHDGAARGFRYLEWSYDPDPGDHTFTVDFAFLLREEDGSTDVRHDRHILGLFSMDEWLRLMEEAGFEPKTISLDSIEPGYRAILGKKP